MLVTQYKLRSASEVLVCWLEAGKLKPWYRVTLKNADDPSRWWTVLEAFNTMDQADVKGGHQSYKWHEKDFHGRLNGLHLTP